MSTSDLPSYYVFNFKDKSGYVFISADYRAAPILAYGKTGHFPINDTSANIGLKSYINEYLTYIQSIRDTVYSFNRTAASMWIDAGIASSTLPCVYEPDAPQPDNCEQQFVDDESDPITPTTYHEWGPLVKTQWGQGPGFNDQAPLLGPDQCRAMTGCVATAMAQIIKYWEHPIWYNYDNMPEGTLSSNEVAKLMRDCGDLLAMDWGCDVSSASTDDARKVLKNEYGYSKDIEYSGYYYSHIRININTGKPVILRACSGSSCHAWVADGLRETIYYNSNGTNTSIKYIHMNWGWAGAYDNWYSSWTWNQDLKIMNHREKQLSIFIQNKLIKRTMKNAFLSIIILLAFGLLSGCKEDESCCVNFPTFPSFKIVDANNNDLLDPNYKNSFIHSEIKISTTFRNQILYLDVRIGDPLPSAGLHFYQVNAIDTSLSYTDFDYREYYIYLSEEEIDTLALHLDGNRIIKKELNGEEWTEYDDIELLFSYT